MPEDIVAHGCVHQFIHSTRCFSVDPVVACQLTRLSSMHPFPGKVPSPGCFHTNPSAKYLATPFQAYSKMGSKESRKEASSDWSVQDSREVPDKGEGTRQRLRDTKSEMGAKDVTWRRPEKPSVYEVYVSWRHGTLSSVSNCGKCQWSREWPKVEAAAGHHSSLHPQDSNCGFCRMHREHHQPLILLKEGVILLNQIHCDRWNIQSEFSSMSILERLPSSVWCVDLPAAPQCINKEQDDSAQHKTSDPRSSTLCGLFKIRIIKTLFWISSLVPD